MEKTENKTNNLTNKNIDNNNIKEKKEEELKNDIKTNDNIIIENNKKEEIDNKNSENEDAQNNDVYDYRALYSDKVLGRFSLHEKIIIINKLNIIVYSKIKKELIMELQRKRLENKILIIKSRYKTALILQKKLHSLIQEKMLRDFNYKKNLKDLRKKLMDEKIEKLKYKNLVFIMKAYGIYREDNNVR